MFVFGFAWFKIVDSEGEKGGPCVSDDSNLKSCLANNQKLEKKTIKRCTHVPNNGVNEKQQVLRLQIGLPKITVTTFQPTCRKDRTKLHLIRFGADE